MITAVMLLSAQAQFVVQVKRVKASIDVTPWCCASCKFRITQQARDVIEAKNAVLADYKLGEIGDDVFLEWVENNTAALQDLGDTMERTQVMKHPAINVRVTSTKNGCRWPAEA